MKLKIIALLMLMTAPLCAEEPFYPEFSGPVVDSIRLLSPRQKADLSAKIIGFEKNYSPRIAVCIVASTLPLPIEEYSIALAERWKTGHAGKDDGIILLIAQDDRKMRIEVGRGMESTITDLKAGRILLSAMTPAFRAGDYYGGIDACVDELILSSGGFTADFRSRLSSLPRTGVKSAYAFPAGLMIMGIGIFIFVFLAYNRKTVLSLVVVLLTSSAGLFLMLGSAEDMIIPLLVSLGLAAFLAFLMRPETKKKRSRKHSRKIDSDADSSDYDLYHNDYSSGSSDSSSESDVHGGGEYGGGGATGSW